MKRYGWAIGLLPLAVATLACGGLDFLVADLFFDEAEEQEEYGTIVGFAWLDSNWDGIAQDTEQRLEGVTVRVYSNGTGQPVSTTTTGVGGSYSGDIFSSGDYTVEFETPPGHMITDKDAGQEPVSSHIQRDTGRSDPLRLEMDFPGRVNGGFVPLLPPIRDQPINELFGNFNPPEPKQDNSLGASCGAVLPVADDDPLEALLAKKWFWFYEGKCGSTAFTLSNGATYGAFSPGAASAPPDPPAPQASTDGDVPVDQPPQVIEPVSEPEAVNPAPESESEAALIGPFTAIDLAATGLSGLGGLLGLALIISAMFAVRQGLQTPVTPIQGRPGGDSPGVDPVGNKLQPGDDVPGRGSAKDVLLGAQPPAADRPPMATPPEETTDCQKLVDIVLQLDFQNLPVPLGTIPLGTRANEPALSDRMREIVDRLRRDCLEEVPEMKSIDPNLPPERQLELLAGELKLSRLGGEEVIL